MSLMIKLLSTLLLFVVPYLSFAADKDKPKVFAQKGRSFEVLSVAFSPDGKMIAVVSRDYTIRLWDVVTGRQIRAFRGHNIVAKSVVFSPDSKMIAFCNSDGTINFLDIATGMEIGKVRGHEKTCYLAFSPDGKMLVSGGGDKMLKLWDVTTGTEIKAFGKFSSELSCISFSPDGKMIVFGNADGTIKLFDVFTGTEIRKFEGIHFRSYSNPRPGVIFQVIYGVTSVVFSPDGRMIASIGEGLDIKLQDVTNGKVIRKYEGHKDDIKSVAFSPDGTTIASGSKDHTIKLWSVATGREIVTLSVHSDAVTSVSFSPNGKWIVSGSWDGTVRLWEVSTGKEIAQFVSFEDGEWVVVTSEGYFNASPNGAKYLNVRVGNDVYPIDEYYKELFKPDYVASILQGKKVGK